MGAVTRDASQMLVVELKRVRVPFMVQLSSATRDTSRAPPTTHEVLYGWPVGPCCSVWCPLSRTRSCRHLPRTLQPPTPPIDGLPSSGMPHPYKLCVGCPPRACPAPVKCALAAFLWYAPIKCVWAALLGYAPPLLSAWAAPLGYASLLFSVPGLPFSGMPDSY
jgi:hypothetical protein